MKVLTKIEKVLTKIELYFGVCCSSLMIGCLALQVLFRKVFNHPLTWTEELAIIFFIFSIYSGSLVAISRGQHLRMEILVSKLKPIPRRIMSIVANICWAALMVYLTFGINIIVQNLYTYGAVTPIVGIPKFLIYGLLPICFILMVYHLAMESLRSWQEIKEIKAGTFVEEQFVDVDGEKVRVDDIKLTDIDSEESEEA